MTPEIKPNDVFRPGKIPVEQNNVYSPRGDKEIDFKKFIDRGWVPVVYGEYGVGKTSLARHILKEYSERSTLVNVESVEGKNFEDVIQQVLESLGYTVTKRLNVSQTTARSAEASSGAKSWIELNAKYSESQSKTVSREIEFAVKSPTESKVISAADAAGVALILDELHKASQEFKKSLTSFIKAYSNANCSNFKIVLLGTSSDASELVDLDEGIDRIVNEIRLPSMETSESNFLIATGMRRLNIEIPMDIKESLIKFAVGSPNILQYLCLEMAEAAFERDGRLIRYGDLEKAVKDYVETKENRLYRKYNSAIETTGPRKYRKLILRALSESEDEYVTMDYISSKVTSYIGTVVPGTSLSGPLRNLKSNEYGEILRDVNRPIGGRVYNLTTFRDPSMKAFIRMINQRGVI